MPALLGACLLALVCEEEEDRTVTGVVEGTVTVDGEPQAGVVVTLTEVSEPFGDDLREVGSVITGPDGRYRFMVEMEGSVPEFSGRVSIGVPLGTTCPSESERVSLLGFRRSTSANFECTTRPPTGAEIADAGYDFRATVDESTCPGIDPGEPQNEDGVEAEFDEQSGELTLVFGSGPVTAPYDPETGAWNPTSEFVAGDGTTFREELTGTWGFEEGMPRFEGTSEVRVWGPDQDPDADPPGCTFSRGVNVISSG